MNFSFSYLVFLRIFALVLITRLLARHLNLTSQSKQIVKPSIIYYLSIILTATNNNHTPTNKNLNVHRVGRAKKLCFKDTPSRTEGQESKQTTKDRLLSIQLSHFQTQSLFPHGSSHQTTYS